MCYVSADVKRQPTLRKLEQLAACLDAASSMLIVMQDQPDPDAIASAVALKAVANAVASVPCSIAHGGIVGRSENRAMVKYLDVNLHAMAEIDLRRFDRIALVDTQPGTGNNSLPPELIPDIVIDHHPVRRATRRCPYTDVRGGYGAPSTILYEYLTEAKVDIDVCLATALLYGIRSDTQDLGRETIQADIDAFLALYPKANKRMLSRIEWGRVPDAYFRMLATALGNARRYDDCIVTSMGSIDNPDMIGEVADLLLRREGAVWVLCHGFFGDNALFSLRTSAPTGKAGDMARRLAGRNGTGGGHAAIAAGQIPLAKNTERERRRLGDLIETRFLRVLARTQAKPERLVRVAQHIAD